MPLAVRARGRRAAGRSSPTGLTIVEDDCAGLFDIATTSERAAPGHARTVVAALLRAARAIGRAHAYLQVASDNEPARALPPVRFEERYPYWYRGREGERH
jgi:ribosomal protein S18 acetylase RimI-like enzyme